MRQPNFLSQSSGNQVTVIKPFNLRWLMLGLILAGLMTYLWQINSLSTYGFRVRELEKQVGSLRENNKGLENQVVNLQSLSSLQQKIDLFSFVPVTNIEYITPVSSVIAQK